MSKVIAYKQIPARLPFNSTLIVWLLLDRIKPSAVIVGVLWTLVALVWIGSIIHVAQQDEVVMPL